MELAAASKSRSIAEIQQAIAAGVKVVAENYVQEAGEKFKAIGRQVKWHFIGHLQRNKVKRAIDIFDMIESVDSWEIAAAIDKACAAEEKKMLVLVEVNCAREKQKSGVFPEDVERLIEQIHRLSNIKVMGLMTLGPFLQNTEQLRPYFRETQRTFEAIKSLGLAGVEMRYLSMGMSDSYRVALQEGANLVRIGSAIFGKRST